ncbi:MAG: hypothetical protein U9Q15_03240 [Patescibacteria group bacterium]|nr:hypothetical protein [Patescibacteria group bacterium]
MSAVSELAIYDKKFDFEFAIERNKLRNVAGKIDFIIDLYDGADTVKTYKKSITPPLNTLDTTASGSVTIDISDLSFEGDGYTYRLEKQGTVLIPEQVAPIAFPTRSNPSFPGTISGNTYTGVTEVPEKYSVVKVYCTDDSVITLPSSTIGNGQTYDLGSCIPESNKQSFRYSTVQYSNSGGSVVPSLDY